MARASAGQNLAALPSVISRLGGLSRIAACGQPTTLIAYQSVLAWDLGVNTGKLFWTRQHARAVPSPIVYFQPLRHGWKVTTVDTPAARRARCRRLNVLQRLA